MTEAQHPICVSRLKNRADFVNCRNGARSHERAFVLQLCKRDDGDDATPGLRVGFTVTKKIGNAVIRNRIKRRLREALKQADIPSHLTQHDAVIIARDHALTADFAELVKSIGHGLKSARHHTPKDRRNTAKNTQSVNKDFPLKP